MAFGGVATGSMKAQLAAIVHGITKKSGFTFIPIEKAISIGAKVAMVAVFEFNSVKKIIKVTKIIISKKILYPSKKEEKLAIQSAKPVMLNALERAIPPPTNNKTPHGILLAVSQLHALLFFLIGIINKRSAPNNPIEVSLIFKSKLLLINLLKIHNIIYS